MEQEYSHCLRCGRRLKNPEYRKIGYGPSCYKKMRKYKLRKKSLLGDVKNDALSRKLS